MKPCHPIGHDEACPLCRLYAKNEAYRLSIDVGITAVVSTRLKRVAIPVIRPDRCQRFTGRTEFRPGCNGWKCKGGCTLGFPAKPGEYCQTCEAYEPDPDYAGQGTQGWMH